MGCGKVGRGGLDHRSLSFGFLNSKFEIMNNYSYVPAEIPKSLYNDSDKFMK